MLCLTTVHRYIPRWVWVCLCIGFSLFKKINLKKMSNNNNITEQQGMGLGKSLAVVFGVLAVMVGLVLAIKYFID